MTLLYIVGPIVALIAVFGAAATISAKVNKLGSSIEDQPDDSE